MNTAIVLHSDLPRQFAHGALVQNLASKRAIEILSYCRWAHMEGYKPYVLKYATYLRGAETVCRFRLWQHGARTRRRL